MTRTLSLLVVLACVLLACAPPPRLVAPLRYSSGGAPDEELRGQAPAISPVAETTEAVRVTALPNGVHVVLVERHDYPVAAVELLIDRGALDLDDPGGRAVGQALYLFARGGNEAVYQQLLAESGKLGATWSGRTTSDATWSSVKAPSRFFDATVGLLARGRVTARISQDEYDLRIAELRRAAGWEPISLATLTRAVLFGRDQAYGYRPMKGAALSLEDAQGLHDRLFQPAHATLVVVGDVTPAQVDESAARWLDGWGASRALPRRTAHRPPRTDHAWPS